MNGRIDADLGANQTNSFAVALAPIAIDDDEHAKPSTLPADHPRAMRDTVSISMRARAFVAKLKPVVIAVVTFWEHRVRSISVAGRRVTVDAAGSYRMH